MGIVQIAFDAGQGIGKTAKLVAVLPRALHVGGHHPADGNSHLHLVTHRCKHPGAIAAHRMSHAADAFLVNLRQCSHKVSRIDVVVGHDSAPAVAQFHQVACHAHMSVLASAFTSATISPVERIGHKDGIALLCQIITHILPTIALRLPPFGILHDGISTGKGTHHLFFSNHIVSPMVMQKNDCGEWPLAIRHQVICFCPCEGRKVEPKLTCLVALAPFCCHHFHLVVARSRWCHLHRIEHTSPRLDPPKVK